MLSIAKQIIMISLSNILALQARLGASLVTVFSSVCVISVFVAVLSMAAGLEKTMLVGASEDVVIILREAAKSEVDSHLSGDQVKLIQYAQGIAKDIDGQPLSSAEQIGVVDVTKRGAKDLASVPIRGVGNKAFKIRDGFRIVEGRQFSPEKNELIVGRAAQLQFTGLDVGSEIDLGRRKWKVVGVFEAEGSVIESEIWCDVRVFQQQYRRGNNFRTVRLKLSDANALGELKMALSSDPRLSVSIKTEKAYYKSQSNGMTTFIKLLGYPVGLLMTIGAIFAALNTMYGSISSRMREIGTLRALGFSDISIIVSTIIESTLLTMLGGTIAMVFVYGFFNGYTASTLNNISYSQVVFNFNVTLSLLCQGVAMALLIGLLGGVFPALRATRTPVVLALKKN